MICHQNSETLEQWVCFVFRWQQSEVARKISHALTNVEVIFNWQHIRCLLCRSFKKEQQNRFSVSVAQWVVLDVRKKRLSLESGVSHIMWVVLHCYGMLPWVRLKHWKRFCKRSSRQCHEAEEGKTAIFVGPATTFQFILYSQTPFKAYNTDQVIVIVENKHVEPIKWPQLVVNVFVAKIRRLAAASKRHKDVLRMQIRSV